MQKIEIKRIGQSEIEELQKVSIQTFIETFGAVNTEENMKLYLDESFNKESLLAELANPESEFYFAIDHNYVIGYLKFNVGSAQTELQDSKSLEIERIYVLGAYQRNRIGQLLFDFAMKTARDRGYEYIWLGVWEKNYKAQNFYQKNGLSQFDSHIFVLGKEKQTDLLMKLVF